ncbi:MAG: hypothetical protein II796_00510 [Oscillospiraceae bacterium]|nr:hypothetical protein [Oscillospiraceae bacterium]
MKFNVRSIIGTYQLIDFFLYHTFKDNFSVSKMHGIANLTFKDKYTSEQIENSLFNFYRRFFDNQFKVHVCQIVLILLVFPFLRTQHGKCGVMLIFVHGILRLRKKIILGMTKQKYIKS